MWRLMCFCILFLFAMGTATSTAKKVEDAYFCGHEGCGRREHVGCSGGLKGREYEKFRRLMTLEVNAAIAGAAEAGATEFIVGDSHAGAQNIDIELLDKRARLIRAWPRPLEMMQGVDSACDAVIFVGYHAREGAAEGVLAHTFTGSVVVKLNGVEVPEAGFNAAIAGDFGVPVVFVSGDQTIA